MDECAICLKHEGRGELPAPPGGYVYEDEHWMVCHAPPSAGPLGTLFIESKRHFLDFSEFNENERSAYGRIAHRASAALKQLTGAARIYHLSTVEGVPHFHIWLVPRAADMPDRSLKYLGRDDTCDENEAMALAARLRTALHQQT
jgi:diadenosine tetraphosphate (Ap4A) HIT family hydrolase